MRGDLLLLLVDGVVILCLARCALQWAKLDSRYPLMQFCIQTTDWLIKPLRKVSPAAGKWDWACVLAGLLLYYVVFMLITFLALPEGFGGKLITANLLFAVISLLKAAAYTLLLSAVIRMVLSFSNPYSPLMAALHKLLEPLSKPFSFLKAGRYDFSGSVVVLAVWILLTSVFPQIMSRLNLWLLQ